MRRALTQIFTRPKLVLEKYLSKQFNLDPRVKPLDLLEYLNSGKTLKIFVDHFNKGQNEKNGLNILKQLTILHLCLINSPDFCAAFRNVNLKKASENEWLNENIIHPYQSFIAKLCYSEEFYQALEANGIIQFSLDNLFFAIKLLKDLFKCSEKISCLYHYYHKLSLPQYPFLLDNFVCLLAYHAQLLYSIFKAILGQFIRFPMHYIHNQQTEKIMKFILDIELGKINELMRQLFLNSFYLPYEKGYGVTLFTVERLPEGTRGYVQSIMYSEIRRSKKKKTLDSIIFDNTGKLNSEIYEGLQHLTANFQSRQRFKQQIQDNFRTPIRKVRDNSEKIQTV